MAEIATIDESRENKSLSDSAYERMQDDIMSCVLVPGKSYTESQLTEQYGMGKAPIRSGLLRLCHEGLVEARARRGYVITPVTIRDVQEIFQLRLILEPEAAALAAGRLNETHLERLNQASRIEYLPGNRQSEAAFLNANKIFHVTIAEAAGNRRLAHMISQLLDEMKRVLHLGLALKARGKKFQHEHMDLLKHLLAGDAAEAKRCVYEQVRGGQEMVIESILSNPEKLNVAGDF